MPVKGAQFVNVALVDDRLYASAAGEMFALDPATGQILWHNKLRRRPQAVPLQPVPDHRG